MLYTTSITLTARTKLQTLPAFSQLFIFFLRVLSNILSFHYSASCKLWLRSLLYNSPLPIITEKPHTLYYPIIPSPLSPLSRYTSLYRATTAQRLSTTPSTHTFIFLTFSRYHIPFVLTLPHISAHSHFYFSYSSIFNIFFFADSPISLPYIPPSSPFFFYFSFRLSLPSRLAISLFSPCPFGCVFRSWDCHSVKSKGSSAALSPYPFMSTPFLSLDTLSTCPLFQSWQKEQLWYPAEFTITQKENKSLIHKRSYSGKHDSLRQRET